MANNPEQLLYTREHEWAERQPGKVRIGVTAYAVQQLGDVTLVDLPAVGTQLVAGKRFGDIESVKTVSELFAPVSGTVVEVNRELEAHPEWVNESPYERGWLVLVDVGANADFVDTLDAAAYAVYVRGLDH